MAKRKSLLAGVPIGMIVCRRVADRRADRCSECGRAAGKSCQFPLRGPKAGQTCGAHLCERCSVLIGHAELCPPHARYANSERLGGATP